MTRNVLSGDADWLNRFQIDSAEQLLDNWLGALDLNGDNCDSCNFLTLLRKSLTHCQQTLRLSSTQSELAIVFIANV